MCISICNLTDCVWVSGFVRHVVRGSILGISVEVVKGEFGEKISGPVSVWDMI